METKIIGVFLCLLLVIFAVPAVDSFSELKLSPIVPIKTQTNSLENWTEIQKLLASDGTSPDNFGWSVSLDGGTALIGAIADDNDKGSAYVFIRNGTNWNQQAKLFASDSATDDYFGYSVSLDGDTALIGAIDDDDNGDNSGSAYAFTRTNNIWTQEAKLLPSDGTTYDNFGCSVSLYGDTALIGALDDDQGKGSVYVFTRTGTCWNQQVKLCTSDGAAGDFFGYSISLDGDTALIGAFGDDDNGWNSGSAYIFIRNNSWIEHQKLLPLDNGEGDYFGWSVALDGDTALIGAKDDQDNGINSGSAYVFTYKDNIWIEQQKLHAVDESIEDEFGSSVSLYRDTALIGAKRQDNLRGSAYIFTRTDTTWTQRAKLLASDGVDMDDFGMSISLDDDTAIIGAHGDDNNKGSAYVFSKVDLTINIDGGLGINLKITNNGIINVTGVPYWIHVKGGILGLINKTMNGTIDISAGETISVAALKLFGLGHITITVKVADVEKLAEGKQIFIFTMIKN
jgi:hypothetical protein